MSTPCIRRPGSIWTNCRCIHCDLEQRRTRKAYEAGRIPVGTASDNLREQAWNIIDRMIQAGWTNSAIAAACGISIRTAHELRQARHTGIRRRLSHSLYRRILNHGQPSPDSYIPATGATRRLQALARIGWSGNHIHDHTGIPRMTLSNLTNGQWQRVRVRIANTIDAAYRELENTPGPSAQARRVAEMRGWAAPAAWDDIDDPEEQPKGLAGSPRIPPADRLADIEHLTDQGLTLEAIAARFGWQPASLLRFLHRHQARDLATRLQDAA